MFFKTARSYSILLLLSLQTICESHDLSPRARRSDGQRKYVRKNMNDWLSFNELIDEENQYWTRQLQLSSSLTMSPSLSPSLSPSSSPTGQPTNTPTTSFPTTPPSSFPSFRCNITPSAREAALFAIAVSVSKDDLVTDGSTPQGQALEWLVNIDPLFLCPSEVDAIIQRYATAVFYLSIGAATTSTDLPGTPECEWAGIICDAGTVSQLQFEEELGGTIPEEIVQFTDLIVLKIEDSLITGSIPSNIGSLQNLLAIDLNINGMTGSIPDSLYLLKNLQQLDLDNNFFTGTLSEDIDDLVSLRFLQLESNSFTGTIPETLGNIAVLEQATFDENKFTGEMPDAVCANRGDGNIGGPLVVLNTDCPPQFFCDCCTILC